MTDPTALYDATASRWTRRRPTSLSDFTGRPAVFELVGEVAGLDVLDAGCGEGYCSRVLAERGPKSLVGFDASSEMIELARRQEQEERRGVRFEVGDIRNIRFADAAFDVAIAVFVFNYLSLADTERALGELHRVLRPGGRLVFAVPHPAFPWMRESAPPFYFETGELGYFEGRDTRHSGAIHRIDGTSLAVQVVHKTFEDYFRILREVGFVQMPVVRELGVKPEHLAAHPEFFGPLRGVPLHVAFALEKVTG